MYLEAINEKMREINEQKYMVNSINQHFKDGGELKDFNVIGANIRKTNKTQTLKLNNKKHTKKLGIIIPNLNNSPTRAKSSFNLSESFHVDDSNKYRIPRNNELSVVKEETHQESSGIYSKTINELKELKDSINSKNSNINSNFSNPENKKSSGWKSNNSVKSNKIMKINGSIDQDKYISKSTDGQILKVLKSKNLKLSSGDIEAEEDLLNKQSDENDNSDINHDVDNLNRTSNESQYTQEFIDNNEKLVLNDNISITSKTKNKEKEKDNEKGGKVNEKTGRGSISKNRNINIYNANFIIQNNTYVDGKLNNTSVSQAQNNSQINQSLHNLDNIIINNSDYNVDNNNKLDSNTSLIKLFNTNENNNDNKNDNISDRKNKGKLADEE